MSDDLFYRITLIGYLVIFSLTVFFLTKFREKKDDTIIQNSKPEYTKFLKL